MRAWEIWETLFSRTHLKEHFFEKIKTKASVGLDKVTVQKFEEMLDEEIDIILRKVSNCTYSFTRYKQVLFSKGPGKPPRIVSVPTVRDKLVASTLNELFMNVYGEQSKSSLPQVIIANILREISNYDYYIKIDISRFYSSISHEKLIKIIRRKIRKREILELIQNAITTETISLPIKEKRERNKRDEGVPEGLPISNALANIYMIDVDAKYKANVNIKYYRYVDDILILVNEEDYENIKNNIIWDMNNLDLEINDEKIESKTVGIPFSYLGYYVCDSYVSVRKSCIFRLEHSIEELIKKCKNGNVKYLEWKLNLKITGFIIDEDKYGWMFFYSQITDTSILHHLDWVVLKLIKRYGFEGELKPKKYVRTFYEITKRLHETRYIPNLNTFTVEDKKELLSDIYEQDVSDMEDSEIEFLFRKIMRREIQDIERDVEHIS